MPTLQIEHEITSFTEWKAAFDNFADMRSTAGVRRHSIYQPVDDAHYVVINLEFDTTEAAQAFLKMLRERVWSSRQNAPALVGDPQTRILETVEGNGVRDRRSAPDQSPAGIVQDSSDVGQEP